MLIYLYYYYYFEVYRLLPKSVLRRHIYINIFHSCHSFGIWGFISVVIVAANCESSLHNSLLLCFFSAANMQVIYINPSSNLIPSRTNLIISENPNYPFGTQNPNSKSVCNNIAPSTSNWWVYLIICSFGFRPVIGSTSIPSSNTFKPSTLEQDMPTCIDSK